MKFPLAQAIWALRAALLAQNVGENGLIDLAQGCKTLDFRAFRPLKFAHPEKIPKRPQQVKVGAIIQVRMSSERLPGKVLLNLCGKPILQYLLESLERCEGLDEVIVATSIEPTDDSISKFCEEYRCLCQRGPLNDVAGRLAEVIVNCSLDVFVRVSGDSPLLDYRLVSEALRIFTKGDYDVVTNVQKRTFPKGQSVEVIRSSTFIEVQPFMTSDYEREHVTPYFYANKNKYSICNFEAGKDYGHIQMSVDTSEDFRQVEWLMALMSKPHWEYTFEDLLGLLP